VILVDFLFGSLEARAICHENIISALSIAIMSFVVKNIEATNIIIGKVEFLILGVKIGKKYEIKFA